MTDVNDGGINGITLLPCPFCGGEAIVTCAGRGKYQTQVRCTRCNCTLSEWFASKKAAVEAWNTRAERTCSYIPDKTGFTWWDENDDEHYEEYSASDECCSASCDKCGFIMMVGDEGWFRGWDEIKEWEEEGSDELHKGYILEPIFNYCPNCCAKVTK